MATWAKVAARGAAATASLLTTTGLLVTTAARTVLVTGLFVACAAGVPAAAATDAAPGLVQVARLQYGGGGDWYCNPTSLPNWLEQFEARTGIPTARREAIVTLDSEDLHRYPLLYLSGHGRIALEPGELAALRRYLDAGGFLWADDNYGLDDSLRATLAELFPDQPLVPLASGHPLYRCYYDLPGLPKIHEHDGDPAQGFGIVRGGRLVVYYSWSSDIGDGLEDPEVHGDPAEAREAAARMAVNVLTWALTQP
jgi:hypothetical protein